VKNDVGAKRLYKTLCNVLDAIRAEAPPSLTVYHPAAGNNDQLIHARSRGLLHLFLKARFGLTSFAEREPYVTDGKHDGGIDAFYIDRANRIIYLIQSKFRANAGNFVSSNMSANDLLKMDVKRILQGKKNSDTGDLYNASIKRLQREIQKLPNSASYAPKVVLLGNAENLSKANLKKLVDGYDTEQIPHQRAYKELLFPVVNGSYFTSPDLTIEINLENIRSGDTHLDYNVKASAVRANIKVLFVPTKEVGRIMDTFKNSILKYNPRSFLELKGNFVNRQIENSICNSAGNEFSLFNNGITLVCDNTVISSNTAKQGRAQVIVTNPQLVNGGQTAYTLSRIYERSAQENDFSVFKGKEVLLKIISSVGPKDAAAASRLELIRNISKASNSQTRVDEADRRSNDPIQLELQEKFFSEYGLYYERKRGEFSDGVHNGYISEGEILNRDKLMRISLATDYRSSQAKTGVGKFFAENVFPNQLSVASVRKYAYGFEVLAAIAQVLRKDKVKGDRWKSKSYGSALRYGEYALVAVCINVGLPSGKPAVEALAQILNQWLKFENWIVKRSTNSAYLIHGKLDAISYYKGSTIDADLKRFDFKLK